MFLFKKKKNFSEEIKKEREKKEKNQRSHETRTANSQIQSWLLNQLDDLRDRQTDRL